MNVTDSTSSNISIAAQGGATVMAVAFFREAIVSMVPFLILAGILILVDVKFGSAAAIKRKEFQITQLIRKTIGKAFEYFCWVTLSATASVAFNIPQLQAVILAIVVANELLSIYRNWAFVHGKSIKGLNWMKLFGSQVGVDLSDVQIEDEKEQTENDENVDIRRKEGKDDPDNKEL